MVKAAIFSCYFVESCYKITITVHRKTFYAHLNYLLRSCFVGPFGVAPGVPSWWQGCHRWQMSWRIPEPKLLRGDRASIIYLSWSGGRRRSRKTCSAFNEVHSKTWSNHKAIQLCLIWKQKFMLLTQLMFLHSSRNYKRKMHFKPKIRMSGNRPACHCRERAGLNRTGPRLRWCCPDLQGRSTCCCQHRTWLRRFQRCRKRNQNL